MECENENDMPKPHEKSLLLNLLHKQRASKVRSGVKIKPKTQIGRKLRWGRYRRKKKRRKPDKSLNLRQISYYKPGLLPALGEALALRIIKVKDRKTPRLYPAWVVLTRFSHQRRNTQSNNVVFSAFINYDLRRVNLETKFTSIEPEQIQNGAKYEQVREELKSFITSYKVISHELCDDLSCFNLLDRFHLCVDLSNKQQGFYDKNYRSISLKTLNWVVNNKIIKTGMRSAITECNIIIQAFHKLEQGYVKSQIDESGSHSFQWIVDEFKRKKNKNYMEKL